MAIPQSGRLIQKIHLQVVFCANAAPMMGPVIEPIAILSVSGVNYDLVAVA